MTQLVLPGVDIEQEGRRPQDRAPPVQTHTIARRATFAERVANYERLIGQPAYLYLNTEGKRPWIVGTWLFNDYRRHAEYHGAYMRHLLKRYAALFFDAQRILHVCSGALKADNQWLPGDTLDINPTHTATYTVNAETCEGVDLGVYDTVFVDVPYTPTDAAIYGYPMLNRKRVLKTLIYGLPANALIVWLDEIPPQYETKWPIAFTAAWGVLTSAGHRGRFVLVYRKTAP